MLHEEIIRTVLENNNRPTNVLYLEVKNLCFGRALEFLLIAKNGYQLSRYLYKLCASFDLAARYLKKRNINILNEGDFKNMLLSYSAEATFLLNLIGFH